MADKSEKKPFYKKWWFWVIVIIIIVAIASGSNSKSDFETTSSSSSSSAATADSSSSSVSSSASSASNASTSTSKSKYTVEEGEVDTSNPFMWQITGTLTNNTSRDVGYIQVEYVLYDADGNQIGTAFDNTNNLKAGGTWKFKASSIDVNDSSEIASWELADVTGF